MKAHILVIDYGGSAEAIADVLTCFGHEAWLTWNGHEGLEILEATNIDVVLVENEIPYLMNGPEFIRVAKQIYPGILCILMGAELVDENLADIARDCGADAHLIKVFDCQQDLELMIQTLMSHRQPRA